MTANARVYVEEALQLVSGGSSSALLPDRAGPLHTRQTEPRQAGRILFADDNADMRAYVSRLLQQHYEVLTVPNGKAALAAVKEYRPDLVVADVMMPELDGFEFLHLLRSDAQTSSLPLILLSARAGEEAQIEGLGVGADDYLVKPFSGRE